MKVKKIIKISLVAALGFVLPLSSKEIPRTEYIKYLPISYPKITSQTEANKIFGLYGDKNDPFYQDIDPIDGIDDRRFKVLQNLAVHFAPYLVQNTCYAPSDFKYFANNDRKFPLYVDTWDFSCETPRLVQSNSVDFNADDSQLLSLIEEFHPERSVINLFSEAKRNPGAEFFKVIYFDFPGQDESSWKKKYGYEILKIQNKQIQGFIKTYVHFFISDETARSQNTSGFEFVLQYWFFYPYNDGGNNHEGDWEHINVVISPVVKVSDFLTVNDINTILQGSGISDDSDDERLVIRRVEYYFHQKVMVLDFSQPNAYIPTTAWEKEITSLAKDRRGRTWIWEKIRSLAYEDTEETKINTHPFAFIGGDCIGYEQILSSPGETNRDSHGNYPFPGIYREVGPGNSSEKISARIDHLTYYKKASSNKTEDTSQFVRGNVLSLDDPAKIEIIPDWERVMDLAVSNKETRKNWFWLILPIRFGYPASSSPFAGLIEHANTGNLSTLGPAYSDAWNRIGGTPMFDVYDPHKLSSLLPLDWQSGFSNELGFFNVVISTLQNIPPFSLVSRILNMSFKGFHSHKPVFYPKQTIPFRFVGISFGMAHQKMPEFFTTLALSSEQTSEIQSRINNIDPDYQSYASSGKHISERIKGMMFQLSFHLGPSLISENTVRYSTATMSENISMKNRNEPLKIREELHLWEYFGSIRFNIKTGKIQPFVKAGYGWTWFRAEDVSVEGQLLSQSKSPWVRKPSLFKGENLLPNSWHYGLGIEVLPVKTLNGLDIGLKLEYLRNHSSFGLNVELSPWSEVAKGKLKANTGNISFSITLNY